MRKFLCMVFAAASALVLASQAQAVPLTQINKFTNDGVYSLSQTQADQLGYSDADFIAFLRPRSGRGVTLATGDTFDATTLFNSTKNDSKIIAFLNGENTGLSYTGDAFDPLGTTTILNNSGSFYEGTAFLFESGVGNIVFNGSATFNEGQSRGAFDREIGAVPVPAALPLLAAGVAALGFAGYRRRR